MSLVVQNLYKLPCQDENLYETIFQAQKEFRRMLEDRTIVVVQETLDFFKKFYEGKAKPKTHQQWVNVCFKQLRSDVYNQKRIEYRIDSDFVHYLSDFLVEVILYKHQEGYFVQIFGSQWAVNEIKSLLHLSKDYSFDDRTDNGYEDEKGMDRMEKDYNFLMELFPENKFKDNGLTFTISDEVPYNDCVTKKLYEVKEDI